MNPGQFTCGSADKVKSNLLVVIVCLISSHLSEAPFHNMFSIVDHVFDHSSHISNWHFTVIVHPRSGRVFHGTGQAEMGFEEQLANT